MDDAPSGTPAARIGQRRVPKFYEDAGRPVMNRLQKSFYRRVFLPSLDAGDPVDVQGQTGYVSMLVYELLDERRTNPIEARNKLQTLVKAYGARDLPYIVTHALADFHFLEGDFAAGYAALGAQVDPSFHLTLAAHIGHPRLTSMQVLRWAEWSITRKGIAHLDAVVDALQARLDGFHARHGVGIVEDFWQRLTADKPLSDVVASIEDVLAPRFNAEGAVALLLEARAKDTPSEAPRAFEGWPGYEKPIDWPGPWVSWSLHGAFLFTLFRALVREAENAARDEARIPRVGEGWVSEMTLLREVQAAFPEERVIHQFSPVWLGPQSLDIYLPDHNIGIEYQGAQHSKPVEYFGGAKAFELQQERDARKQALCEHHGCVLIEVHPGYHRELVLAQVMEAIQKARGGTNLET